MAIYDSSSSGSSSGSGFGAGFGSELDPSEGSCILSFASDDCSTWHASHPRL